MSLSLLQNSVTLSFISFWFALRGVGVNFRPLVRMSILVFDRGFEERLITFGFSWEPESSLCPGGPGFGLKNVGWSFVDVCF